MTIRVSGLYIENAGLFKAMTLRLDGKSKVIAGGPNEGKTTLIEFLAYALSGGRKTPKVQNMVKDGETKGEAVIILKDWKSGEEFTLSLSGRIDKKGEQVVEVRCTTSASEEPLSREDIRALLSRVGPDILELQKLPATGNNGANQVNRLLEMFGLDADYNRIQKEREELYTRRRDTNRNLKNIEGTLKTTPTVPPDTPDQPLETSALMAELKAAHERNAKFQRASEDLKRAGDKVTALNAEIERLSAQRDEITATMPNLQETRRQNTPIATTAIEEKAANIDKVNALVAQKQKRAALQDEIRKVTTFSNKLDKEIADKDAELTGLIQKVDLGVPGLSFDEEVGLKLNDKPLITEGQSMQMRTYATLALNSLKGQPDKIGTFVLDGAESIGEDGIREVIQAADAAGAQVLMTFNTKQKILKDENYVIYIHAGAEVK